MKIFHHNFLPPIASNIEASGNKEDGNNSDNSEAENVPMDSEPEGEDDVIHVQQLQRVQYTMGWPTIMWAWTKGLFV